MNARDSVVSGGRGRWVCGAVAFVTGMFVGSTADALSYSAKSISAVVIDADTKQPLSDVNVLVVWSLQNSNASSESFWVIDEAVTDKQGQFVLSGWGPKLVPQKVGALPQRLGPDQPGIYLFKSGYEFDVISNPWESRMIGNQAWRGDLVRESVWTNKKIELRRFVGTERQYLSSLSMTAGGLPLQGCTWTTFPRFTAALVIERGERIQFPDSSSLPSIKDLEENAKNVPGCPMPTVTLAPFLK